MRKIYLFISFFFAIVSVWGQGNVGIGTATPNISALLELNANDKGLLVPRMSTAQRLVIPTSPTQEALLVYDLNDKLFYFWDASQWIGFPLPSYNQILNFSAATQILSLTDGGGTLTTNLPMFNTNLNFDILTQTLSLTDAGGTLSNNLPMFNTTLSFNNATQSLSITDAGGTLTTPLQVNNISLSFDSLTNQLSITDGGGIITTNLNLNVDDYDWTRTPAMNTMYPSNLGDRIGLGTNSPDINALLELNSTTQGFLTSRMTTIQRLAIAAPPVGLEVFDITAGVKMFFNGTRWLEIGAVPIGSIQAWHKSMAATPALPWGWVECNGQVVADPESPYNGTNVPDLNISERFLRGNAVSGNLQTEELSSHNHTGLSNPDGDHNHTIDAPNTPSDIAGNHNHTGISSTVTNFNPSLWIPYDDNLSDNCEGDWNDDNPSLCGSGWNGKNTSGNFMGKLDDGCLNHAHLISPDGNHSHNTDISPFLSANAGTHQHTFTTNNTGGAETRPVNMSVVWIMRVK